MINADRCARDVVVVGASAGGVPTLIALFAKLPRDLPAAVAVVLHRSPYHESNLSRVLARWANLSIVEPADGTALEGRRVYIAPRDHHMTLEDGRVRIHRGPKEHRTRPAVDPLFRSAADVYGPRVVGVLLTGGGEDGVQGLIRIKAAGGLSIAQDPNEAPFPFMPMNAIVYDSVDAVLQVEMIAAAIPLLARGEQVIAPVRPRGGRLPEVDAEGTVEP